MSELTFEDLTKVLEKMRSWCNHDDLFEESAMGLPIEHTYIFRCKCGKTRLLKPPKEMMDNLKEDMDFLHKSLNDDNCEIDELFGIKIVKSKIDDVKNIIN